MARALSVTSWATAHEEQAAARVATEVAMKASVVAKTEGVNALAAAAHAAMLAEEAKARAETARSDAAEMMTMFMARITGVPAIQSGSPKKELTDKERDMDDATTSAGAKATSPRGKGKKDETVIESNVSHHGWDVLTGIGVSGRPAGGGQNVPR